MLDGLIFILLGGYTVYVLRRLFKKKKASSHCDGHCLGCPYK